MSHLLTIKTLFGDREVLKSTVAKRKGNLLGEGSWDVSSYNKNVKGLGIKMPDMSYNMVVQDGGNLVYESMDRMDAVDGFRHDYATEKVRRDLAMQGITAQVTEKVEANGDHVTIMEV